MKILKYVLGIIALLVLVFILIGAFASEIAYDDEITVNKPLAECWAVSQDEDKMADWLVGFEGIEHISGPKDQVGSVSDVYITDNGQKYTIRETITAIVPNESISMTFTSDYSDMDYTLRMADVDGKTKISSSTKVKGKGIFYSSLMAIMSSTIKAQEETNLANLKRTIEANTKDYSPSPAEEEVEQE
ncbi:MAG: SRPBCC family protein [Flavobacteriaceae bacterium]|nr:SRPBCC family protein [Flavobacteriaceae bacterium]